MSTSTQIKFRLANNLPEMVSGELQDEVITILKTENLISTLPKCQEVWAIYEGKVIPNISLLEAHNLWTEARLPKLPAFSALPQQSLDVPIPSSIVRVSVECIDRRSGGMGSFYGFEGYYLSLLVSLSKKCIWDARGELAS